MATPSVTMATMHNSIGRLFKRNLFWTKKKAKFGNYTVVKPGKVSPVLSVPGDVIKPEYYLTGVPGNGPAEPEVKNKEQIKGMRDSCRLAANLLKAVGSVIKVGMTTDEIDRFVHRLAIENIAYPSPLNYRNFPKSVCTSVNNVACHGIPDDRPLEDGDIVNVDITVFFNGYHGDCSKNFGVGTVDEQGTRLMEASELCLRQAIDLCRPNVSMHTLGCRIEQKANDLGFNVIPCFLGHGIGSYFHGAPEVFHFSNSDEMPMKAGMTFTIEPVLTPGIPQVYILEDEWTAVTSDDARTAQYEHTVLITENGCEILTLPDD